MLSFFLLAFIVRGQAQQKQSLNYYSDVVLNKIEATLDQRNSIKSIRSELDLKLSDIKNNVGLSVDEIAAKNKQVYNEAFLKYNAVLSDEQKSMVKKLLFEVQLENVRNGHGTFHESDHFKKRMELFKTDPLPKKAIIFLGNSITEQGNWKSLFPDKAVYNRGIGGDNTFGVLARLDEIIESKPEKIFLMIGINDLGSRQWDNTLILENYNKIVDKIRKGTPKTRLYIQSILPLNDSLLKGASYRNKADTIMKLNNELQLIGDSKCAGFIDLYSLFHHGDNILDSKYTRDGIHLLPDGYSVWMEFLKKNKYL
ncbi:GDSL-type esterase/lipase family protein [Sphingobacterium paucimobilis]|uniref:SGNH hydrolase-type esterase domain-containing protein n=1 Tax=Sphingobacterium paucimobilis HER1398 TaxID=1346330 RepID=U2HSS7_9SPHI|nr:GDSL-type esterase/lipase family protein [Sphingobacterium paucimobilis]ERJ58340.1 hypothetical protein M472_06125 [Sphingobacterium paucimobilis HER1398]